LTKLLTIVNIGGNPVNKSATLEHGKFGHLIGQSAPMQEVYYLISKVAPTRATVLITGESGTGKELVAQTIHDLSNRASGPFIGINCGAITTELIGSALFGHERGSFTGANQAHRGYFEQASGGTLFLDELPETNPELQVKLLRVLETGKVIPVGGKRQIPVDVRVIAATNRNPLQAVKSGVLREDLYYRLSTFPIHLPPLRERDNDIVLLAQYYLKQFNQENQRDVRLTPAAIDKLTAFNWPGNVRELKNVIQRAFILADDKINPEHINTELHSTAADINIAIGTPLVEAEQYLIKATLDFYQGDQQKTATALGISLKSLLQALNQQQTAAREVS
jgi:DNA-binding NtrC family response regulator